MTRSDTFLGLLAVAALCGAPALGAQQQPPAAEQKPHGEAEIQALIEQLGAERNADRKAAEGALAGIGDAARAALETAVEGHDDPEVRWRARRVLRKLDGDRRRLEPRRQDAGPERAAPERGTTDQDVHDRVQEMMERMERAFGEDFGRLRGLEDLQRQMDDISKQFEQMHRGLGQGFEVRGIPPGVAGQNVQIQLGPDGVKVEVQTDGESETYEAESIEAFREKHPEIADRYLGKGGGFGFQDFGLRFLDTDRDGLPDARIRDRLRFLDTDRDGLPDARIRVPGAPERGAVPRELRPLLRVAPDAIERGGIEVVPPVETAEPPPVGERLGVYLGDLAPAVREFLEIPPGQGILVQEVEDGSLAAELGIRSKDVVLKIGDREIGGAADVRAALRAIGKGAEVTVDVNRRGDVVTLTGTKRADAPAAGSGLRKRDSDDPKKR